MGRSSRPLTDDEKALAENSYSLCLAFAKRLERYYAGRLDYDGLLSAAGHGLLLAVRRYDPEKGTLGAYAWRMMRAAAMWEAMRNRVLAVPHWACTRPAASPDLARRAIAFASMQRAESCQAIPAPQVDHAVRLDVSEAIETLDPASRDVMRRRHFDGQSLTEIAAPLGISRQAIKYRHDKAARTLRLALNDYRDDECKRQKKLSA